MDRNQWHAFVDALYDCEEAKRDAVMRQRLANYQYSQASKAARRQYEDACDAQNLMCDMAGIRRVNPSFHKLPVDNRPLDVVYADRTGETYNDGLSNTIIGRALSGAANLSGLGRAFLDNYHRI